MGHNNNKIIGGTPKPTEPKPTEPDAFKQRVIDECEALDVNRGKLKTFLAGESYQKLPNAEQGRLTRQFNCMNAYAAALTARIDADFK
jgi:hypothetical protein